MKIDIIIRQRHLFTYERENKMKKLFCFSLALALCLCAVSVDIFSVSAAGENLLKGAKYEYTSGGEFFSPFTDSNCTLLTNGEYRGDGVNSFNDMYAVEGVSTEFVGAASATRYNTTVVFSLDGEITLESMVFRGFRRVLTGNRYINIAGIEVSENGSDFSSAAYSGDVVPIDGAPLYENSNQFFDVEVTFTKKLEKVNYIRVTFNSIAPNGQAYYLCQLDEVEAYGQKTNKYPLKAELSLEPSKNTVDIGETFSVTVLFKNITAANGIVGCDLPLVYDRNKLTLVNVEGVFPSSWGQSGVAASDSNRSEDPLWLHAFCDADDLAVNSAYNVKGNGQFGMILTFMSVSSGSAVISIDNDIEKGVFLLAVNGGDFENCGVAGASASVTVTQNVAKNFAGDVNDDGVVDNSDAALVLRYDAHLTTFDKDQLERADFNGDGVVDNADAADILRYDSNLM